jgi:hypothetical protein
MHHPFLFSGPRGPPTGPMSHGGGGGHGGPGGPGGHVGGGGSGGGYKSVMCKSFESGMSCKFGASCNFAHGHAEMRSHQGGGGGGGGRQQGLPMHHRPSPSALMTPASSSVGQALQSGKFKTVMCDNIMDQGVCPRGFACGFAHSQARKNF